MGYVSTSGAHPPELDAPPVTIGRWLGPADRASFGWLSTPGAIATASAVLILPAVGYQYWSAHRTTRVLAERLAGGGHTVLRLDYHGCGDAAGSPRDPRRVEAWRESAALAAAELRALGCRRLTLVGVRLGATLALLDARSLGAEAVAAWEPVPSGRHFVREIRMLGSEVPGQIGALAAAGVLYTAETLAELEQLEAAALVAAPAPRTLLVAGREETDMLASLRAAGCEDASATVADGASALEVPTEDATVPLAVVDAICTWLGRAPAVEPALSGTSLGRERMTLGDALREEVVSLGDERLVGVLTEPDVLRARAATVVFLNSGSEPHVGPGRAWVEYARALARRGHRCLRVDFRGWGESPDGGHAPGRPYDAHCEEDAIAMVRALREGGIGDRVVLAGLCAGAWVALRVALREPLAGVIALNPQLYWRPGDPVEALMSDTRARRVPERRREARGARWGLWSALDLAGQRPWAARWLDRLVASATPASLVFAEGDDGVEYLQKRLGRRLRGAVGSGVVRVVEVPDIDHAMHRLWLRERMVEAIATELERMTAESANVQSVA